MSDTAEILEQAARWREAGKGVALATVVNTWGSSPRPVGVEARGRRRGRVCRLGVGRLRRGRGRRGGAGGDPRRQAAPARFRRQQRTGLGSRSRLRRQDRDLCRARRMKGRFLDAVIAAGRDSALGRAGDRSSRAGAQLLLGRRADRGRSGARRGGARRDARRAARRPQPADRDRRPAASSSRCSARRGAAS